jgi:hypothetical protein
MKIFFDCEMTGLHQNTTLISLGVISDYAKEFYAEFTDYDKEYVEKDSWLQENVITHLKFNEVDPFCTTVGSVTNCKGDTDFVTKHFKKWLSQFTKVELWSDCHHYDVTLLFELFGGAFFVPDNVYYIPFDICTLFKAAGIDPDISREAFIDHPIVGDKHNAIYDAKVIRACYDKLKRNYLSRL